ncbi:hypothetical protein M514_18493, partial [Trichuris suis]
WISRVSHSLRSIIFMHSARAHETSSKRRLKMVRPSLPPDVLGCIATNLPSIVGIIQLIVQLTTWVKISSPLQQASN